MRGYMGATSFAKPSTLILSSAASGTNSVEAAVASSLPATSALMRLVVPPVLAIWILSIGTPLVCSIASANMCGAEPGAETPKVLSASSPQELICGRTYIAYGYPSMLEPTNLKSAPFSSAGRASPGVGSAESASPASTARITSLLPLSSMMSTSRPRFAQKPLCLAMKKKPASPLEARMAWRHFSAARAARGEIIGAASRDAEPAANERRVIMGFFLTLRRQCRDHRVDRRLGERPAERALIGRDIRARGGLDGRRGLRFQAFRQGVHRFLLQPLRLELERLDPGAEQLGRAFVEQRRVGLEHPAQRADRADHVRLPGPHLVGEPLDLIGRKKALLRRHPEQEQHHIDVDAAAVLQLQAGLGDAGAAIIAEREFPERRSLRGGDGFDAAHATLISAQPRHAPRKRGIQYSREDRGIRFDRIVGVTGLPAFAGNDDGEAVFLPRRNGP